MKIISLILVIFFAFMSNADAQTAEQKKPTKTMKCGSESMSMANHMMGHCMMMQDMMNMMSGMMDMQEKMLKGVSDAEKEKLLKDIAAMREKMHKMMSMHKDMGMCMKHKRSMQNQREPSQDEKGAPQTPQKQHVH